MRTAWRQKHDGDHWAQGLLGRPRDGKPHPYVTILHHESRCIVDLPTTGVVLIEILDRKINLFRPTLDLRPGSTCRPA